MSNITGQVNELLHGHDRNAVCGGAYSLANINEFLKEAYQINARVGELLGFLRSIRQPYLSTAPPPRRKHVAHGQAQQLAQSQQQHFSDAQRDTIDAEAKSTLRDLHAAVHTLAQAETVRHDAEAALTKTRRKKRNFGALGQWAAGGGVERLSPEDEAEEASIKTIKTHREAIVWFLRRKLEECGRVQSTMMETRISRELEKSKSILHKSAGSIGSLSAREDPRGKQASGPSRQPASGMTLDELDSYAAGEQALNEEQMQLFAQENRDMLKHYQDRLDQVRTAEKSLLEISELQSTLAGSLQSQQAHIDQLVQDSFYAEENVGGGNKQLKKASERKSTAKLVFYSTCGLCVFLVGWDLIF